MLQQVTKVSFLDYLSIHVVTSDLSLLFGLFIYTCCNKGLNSPFWTIYLYMLQQVTKVSFLDYLSIHVATSD